MPGVPASAWNAAVETGGGFRDGAWAAELTGDVLDRLAEGHAADCPRGTAPSQRP